MTTYNQRYFESNLDYFAALQNYLICNENITGKSIYYPNVLQSAPKCSNVPHYRKNHISQN